MLVLSAAPVCRRLRETLVGPDESAAPPRSASPSEPSAFAAGRSHLNEGPWRAIWTSCAQSDAVGQRRRRRELPRLGVQSTCQGDAGRIQHRGEPPVVATQRCPTAFDPAPEGLDPPEGLLQIGGLDVESSPGVGSGAAGGSLRPADAVIARPDDPIVRVEVGIGERRLKRPPPTARDGNAAPTRIWRPDIQTSSRASRTGC
jgi:hypothetical protein